MPQNYSDALADAIVERMCGIFRGRKIELQERIVEMVQEYRRLDDPAINPLASDILRISAFMRHIMSTAIGITIKTLDYYLEEELDFDTVYDAMMEEGESIWHTRFAAWLKAFQSSVPKKMIMDKKAMRKMVRDLMPVLFTPAQIDAIRHKSNGGYSG